MTQKEFKAVYLGLKKSTKTTKNTKNIKSLDVTLPSHVDWRGIAVTDVKNQGQCGSCWAFSATGSAEGAYAIKNNEVKSFSEQQLIDCAGGNWGNNGCNGGLMDRAFKYVIDKGLMLESEYGYTAADGFCQYKAEEVVFTPSSYTDVEMYNTDALMAAIHQQPVSVGIEADSHYFQLYTSGVFNHWSCGTDINHGVLAVGYGTDSGIWGLDYWLVKNSWGKNWGLSGYIMMARRATGVGMCGITAEASYPSA